MESAKDWFGEERTEIQVVDDGMVFYLTSLLENTVFADHVRDYYHGKISKKMLLEDYEKLKTEFYNNQIDKITSGQNYNQGDIVNHLRKLK